MQQGTHGAGPHGLLAEGSRVTGAVLAHASAPVAGAIPWLLLRATSADAAGRLRAVTLIRRIDTLGGVTPTSGCDAARVGQVVRIRYSAL